MSNNCPCARRNLGKIWFPGNYKNQKNEKSISSLTIAFFIFTFLGNIQIIGESCEPKCMCIIFLWSRKKTYLFWHILHRIDINLLQFLRNCNHIHYYIATVAEALERWKLAIRISPRDCNVRWILDTELQNHSLRNCNKLMSILCKMCQKRYVFFLDHRKLMQIHFGSQDSPLIWLIPKNCKNEKSNSQGRKIYRRCRVLSTMICCMIPFFGA